MNIVTGAAPSVVLLQHQTVTIRLTRENGPRTVFKVFGSPFSQAKGTWGAFGYESGEAVSLWDRIPRDVDVVITHTPPRSYCDQKPDGTFVGCDALRMALSRIRPSLAVCGHVHEGRGYGRIRWYCAGRGTGHDADDINITGGVDPVVYGTLPPKQSKKMNLVDLTGKRGDRLDNYGFSISREIAGLQPLSKTTLGMEPMLPVLDNAESAADAVPEQGKGNEEKAKANSPPSPSLSTESHHLGYLPLLRNETCIINAAIMATSWPHRGGKQFNAPIVVDLELPEWQGGTGVAFAG